MRFKLCRFFVTAKHCNHCGVPSVAVIKAPMKLFVALLLTLSSAYSWADSTTTLVGYECDRKRDQLLLTYGRTATGSPQWDPSTLVKMKDDDHIGATTSIERKCRLSDGTYSIRLFPAPGNYNVQGQCGGWIAAGAEVKKGTQLIYRINSFQTCYPSFGPITTRVLILPQGQPPQTTEVSYDDFYQ